MSGLLSVTTEPSIAALGSDTWARLAHGRSFYLGYPWLSWAESDPLFDTAYLVVRDAAGVARAAVATYLWRALDGPSMNLAYSPGHIAEENSGRALSPGEHALFFPVLLVGSRAGYHGGVVVDPALDERQRAAALTALFAAVEETAERLDAASVAMLYVPVEHAAECEEAWRRAVADPDRRPLLATQSAEAVIVLDGGADPDADRAARRREWGRERRRYQAALDRLAVLPLSRSVEIAGPLLAATQRKYGGTDSDEDMCRYLASQVPTLDPHSRVLVEYAGEAAVAFSLCYLWEDGVYVRAAGFAPDAAPYSYFNLTMYRPSDLARERGLSHVNLGAGTYTAKRARGAEPRYTASLVRPPVAASPALKAAFQTTGGDARQALEVWGPIRPPFIPSPRKG